MSALLSADQLGEIYTVSGRTVRRWHDEGRIPAEVCEGTTLRFDPDQVAVVLKNRARKLEKLKKSPALA